MDIRVGHACHLLSESDDTISEIAYQTGFESLTYFNRVFLRKRGLRPREFRKGVSDNIQNGDGKAPYDKAGTKGGGQRHGDEYKFCAFHKIDIYS